MARGEGACGEVEAALRIGAGFGDLGEGAGLVEALGVESDAGAGGSAAGDAGLRVEWRWVAGLAGGVEAAGVEEAGVGGRRAIPQGGNDVREVPGGDAAAAGVHDHRTVELVIAGGAEDGDLTEEVVEFVMIGIEGDGGVLIEDLGFIDAGGDGDEGVIGIGLVGVDHRAAEGAEEPSDGGILGSGGGGVGGVGVEEGELPVPLGEAFGGVVLEGAHGLGGDAGALGVADEVQLDRAVAGHVGDGLADEPHEAGDLLDRLSRGAAVGRPAVGEGRVIPLVAQGASEFASPDGGIG